MTPITFQVMVRYHRALYLSRLLNDPLLSPEFMQSDVLLGTLQELGLEEFSPAAGPHVQPGWPVLLHFSNVRSEEQREDRESPVTLRSADVIRSLERYLADPAHRVGLSTFEEKLDRIRQIFSLDEIEKEIVRFATLIRIDQHLSELFEDRSTATIRRNAVRLIGRLIDHSPDSVWMCLRPGAKLFRSGIFRIPEFRPNYGEVCPELSEPLLRILADTGLGADRLVEGFSNRIPEPLLNPGDYRHMSIDLEICTGILRHAWAGDVKGVNLLLFGRPGSGKTQFARVLAQTLEASAYPVPVLDDQTGENHSSVDRRLIATALQQLSTWEERPLVVFDEADALLNDAEPMFRGRSISDESRKSWLIQVLEENPVPVIWIVNRFGDIHTAVKRRFTYSVGFAELGRAETLRVWTRELDAASTTYQQTVDDDDYDLVCAGFSPGQISQVVDTWRRATAEGSPDRRTLDQIVLQAQRLHHGLEYQPQSLNALDDRYDPTILALSDGMEPDQIIRAVCHFFDREDAENAGDTPCRGHMTLLFHGPSGAGKTEFVKYLGRETRRYVQLERMSDLLSMWVGESEKNLARAFNRATWQGNILLLDELDALAMDRGMATHRWESSLVSELLQQVENHRGVLIGCTNLVDSLDIAFYRRFSLKVGFEGIRTGRRSEVIRTYFADLLGEQVLEPEQEQAIRVLPNLYPGDLRIARQKCESSRALGEAVSWDTVVTELERESRFRESQRGRIGFGT